MASRNYGSWMWADALEMMERADRLRRQFYQVRASSGSSPTWEPPVDLFRTENELWIQVALVGVPPEQMDVTIAEGVVTVSGERRWAPESRGAELHRVEIPHGRFERRIELPPGRYEINRRDLVNGLLTLSLRIVR